MSMNYLRQLRSLPGLFLVLRPDERFTIVEASDGYLRATLTTRDGIVGRGLFEVFPGSPEDPASNATGNLRKSLHTVLSTRAEHEMALQRYEIPRPEGQGGGVEERWWRPVNAPVLGDDGQVELIVHRIEEDNDRQRRIYEAVLSSTPDLVYIFDLDHRFIYANPALLRMWGKTAGEALGRNCLELGYADWHAAMHDREIEQVIAARAPIQGEVPFEGATGRRIWDYIFVPVIGPRGDVVAIAGTSRETTDRRAAEEAIAMQAVRLQEADRAKDEFIATLSHELRNPLAPLRNVVALLRMPGHDPARAGKLVDMMDRHVDHLVRLVDDLLEMSRINRGDFALRLERMRLQDAVRSGLEACAGIVEARRHQLETRLPGEAVWVDADPVRLAQVICNLVDNAAKYTPEGGRITVTVAREAGQAVVCVRDNGSGLTAAARARIFEMFDRGDRAEHRGEGGLGIGLALARQLAQMHGATLEAASDGPGKGSEFTLRLAAVEAPAGAHVQTVPPDGLGRHRILVVDDNRDAADSLGMVLREMGAEVQIAHDGPSALEAFPRFDPSAVLLDIGMPQMDGYEVAREMRDRFPGRRTAIIALTGWGQEQDRARAAKAGFDHHITKPADLGELRSLLATI